jgi:alkanesulfonate monooxygenase
VQFERVAQACADAGRDPAQLVRSCAHTLVIGATSADVARRGESLGLSADELSTDPLAGTPAQIVDQLGRWREQTGITRVYLQVLDLADLGQLDLVAAEVAPQLA